MRLQITNESAVVARPIVSQSMGGSGGPEFPRVWCRGLEAEWRCSRVAHQMNILAQTDKVYS